MSLLNTQLFEVAVSDFLMVTIYYKLSFNFPSFPFPLLADEDTIQTFGTFGYTICPGVSIRKQNKADKTSKVHW